MEYHVKRHNRIERAGVERQRLIQVVLLNGKQRFDAEFSRAPTTDLEGRGAELNSGPLAASGCNKEREWAARTAAEIQKAARRCEAEALSVSPQFVGAHPGMLSDIVAVRFTPKLTH